MKPEKVQLMGILNITPDSFAESIPLFNASLNKKLLLKKANEMIKNGATILDIGAESSGPNSKNVSLKEELKRILPALEIIIPLCQKHKILVSVDTYKSEVADVALTLGANIINDITGLRGDKQMAKIIAKHKAKVVIMYSKDKTARTTKKAKKYKNVIGTIRKFLDKQIAYAIKNGIEKKNIIIDPGMGAFISSDPKYSYEILERLKELKSFALPILIGTSRKSMLKVAPSKRLKPSVETAMQGARNGANILRVHDVKQHAIALKSNLR